MRKAIYIWLIGFSLCINIAESQIKDENASFFHLTTKDGLSQSSVFAITQDYLGFMWIGTRDGLNKYDARKFIIYRNILSDSTSLSHNYVTSVFEDSKNRLWVGTAEGLNLFDRRLDKFQRISIAGNRHWRPLVHAINEDTKGNLWFSTTQGLFFLAHNSLDKIPILLFEGISAGGLKFPDGSNIIHHLYEDSKGRYWLSTANGVHVFTFFLPAKKLILSKSFVNTPGALNSEEVRFVYEMKPNIYWFGTKEGGINVYDELNNSFSYLKTNSLNASKSLGSNDVRSLVKDKFEGYWIGTINGLSHYSESTGFTTFHKNDLDSYSIIDNSIRPIFQDHRGSMWVGTYYGGVSVYDRSLPLFRNYARNTYQQSLSYDVVSGILQDDNHNFWIGTEGGGLNYMTQDKKVLRKYKHDSNNSSSLSNNHVKSIDLDREQNLWIGTYTGGLNLLKKDGKGFIHFKNDPENPHSISNNNVYAVKEDREGNIWIGTYGGGLNVKKAGTERHFIQYRPGKAYPLNLSSELVRTVFIDSKENIWVGTEDGLNVKWADKDSFEQFRYSDQDPNSISGNVVISIYEDTKGRLWIGTSRSGMNEFLYAEKKFRRIAEKDGLAGNSIIAIVENNGILWISTNKGICALNVKDDQIKKYNIKDGLLGSEFSIGAVCKSLSGELLFGGAHGITAFYPDDIPNSAYYPKVAFTDFRIFNQSVVPRKDGVLSAHISEMPHVVLNYQQNIFSVDFSTLNYVIPDKNKFAYRLDGLEEQWNYVETPTATYTNLAPGNYSLLIKGASNDGVWGAHPQKLSITILPPPWLTWWAYLIYILLAGFALWSIIWFTKSRSELKYQLHLREIEAENERKLNRIKSNFFTNISHELRTPLMLIINPLHHILSSMKVDASLQPMLTTMKYNAQRLLQLVNELLDLRKNELGLMKLRVREYNILSLLNDVLSLFDDQIKRKEIKISILFDEKELYVWLDTNQMEKVLYNLISNALRYIPEKGIIEIKLKVIPANENYPNGSVKIDVWDNGLGIPPGEQASIFELFYQGENEKYSQMKYGGGVGLALTKDIVELHGGTIKVESHYNDAYMDSFTCFTIEIPLGNQHFSKESMWKDNDVYLEEDRQTHLMSEVSAFVSKHAPDDNDDPVELERAVLMVVDDNADIRNLLYQGLSSQYSVLLAADGEEAWRIIQQDLPDVIISDVMMPKMDGMSLTKLIKGTTATSHIPVILLTALSSDHDIRSGMYMGSDDYIVKPIHLDLLLLKIQNMLFTRKNFRKMFIQEFVLLDNKKDGENHNEEHKFLAKIVKFIQHNLAESEMNVIKLSAELGMSRPVLYRKIKQLTGLSIIELINVLRMRQASKLLCDPGLMVSEIAYQIGYNDPKYFSKMFKTFYGITPSQFSNLDMEEKAGLMNADYLYNALKVYKIDV